MIRCKSVPHSTQCVQLYGILNWSVTDQNDKNMINNVQKKDQYCSKKRSNIFKIYLDTIILSLATLKLKEEQE